MSNISVWLYTNETLKYFHEKLLLYWFLLQAQTTEIFLACSQISKFSLAYTLQIISINYAINDLNKRRLAWKSDNKI